MNIHFTDEKLLHNLTINTVSQFTVGSEMYGLDNENSDIDWLSIYLEDESNKDSFMWEHHQLQHKHSGIDSNFTTLQGFIRNALTGDATINFEVLHSNDLKEDENLSWLWEMRHDFRNYNIIKSYLGMAKRDLKYWRKDSFGGKKNTSETDKKLTHSIRGVIFAKNLLDKNFSLDLSLTTTFAECGYNDFELLHRLKNGALDYSYEMLVTYFENLMNESRNKLNELHNSKDIVMFMEVDKLKKLDELTKDFIGMYQTEEDLYELNYGNLFYETLENGLQY